MQEQLDRGRIQTSIKLALVVFLFFVPSITHAASTGDTIVFGGDLAYPPFEWSQHGKPVGFTIEIEDAMAAAAGVHAEHRLDDWPIIIRALRSGEVDAVPMFRSQERESDLIFTSAIYYVHHSIYARRGSRELDSLESLKGKTVAVEELSYAHRAIEENESGIRLYLAPNTLAALEALEDGLADAAVLALPAANELVRQHQLTVQAIGKPFWPREYAFAVRKDRRDLARLLRKSLGDVVTSGVYDEIHEKWEERLEGRNNQLAASVRNAAIIVVPLFLLAAVGFAWSWTLRTTIQRRTSELETELSRRESAERALKHSVDHDTFTQLPELHHFVSLVDRKLPSDTTERSRLREVMVLKMVDLQSVARTFGHDAASGLVLAFAERLRDAGYAVCGYLGRGVYAVYSDKKPTRLSFKDLAERIRVGDLELHPNLVGGSAYWPEDGASASDLVQRAETAMATSQARNHEWAAYEPKMEPDEVDIRIISEFRKSDGKDLFAVFQPQVDFATGEVVGAEALVRWVHPQLGFISPVKFIPLLERAGLITRVTRRMISEAVRVASIISSRGRDCVISVNVAAHDLIETDLIDIVSRELEKYDCKPNLLKLELTETSVAEDPQRVRESLEALERLGVIASVDDFGTGYSSLSYLSSFPIYEIKIDQVFVNGMTSSHRKLSIVRSVIAMAKELEMTSVAEGAENEETLCALKAAGCNKVQGYAIAKPMAEKDFLLFLESYEGLRLPSP